LTVESDWVRSDHVPWLVNTVSVLSANRPVQMRRKLRLLGVAICRRVWRLLSEDYHRAIEVVERYADGLVTYSEFQQRRPNPKPISQGGTPGEHAVTRLFKREVFYAVTEAFSSAPYALCWERGLIGAACDEVASQERRDLAALVHDIFGNPFRPVAFDPSWRTSTSIGLAQSIYESRDFAAMPILADALEEAGCDEPSVLTHCRSDGPHVRGCWVVDLVLGKS
jgi:hypothetical protein